MTIKTVIFDIDGTLYDFNHSNNLALDRLRDYTRENFSWTREEFDAKHAKVQKDIYSMMGWNGSCRDRILRYKMMLEDSSLPIMPYAARMHELYWTTMLDSLRLYDGAQEVMKELKTRGLTVGIGTDMTVYIQMLKLERMNLSGYVDFIATSEEAGKEKPSPEIFRMCTEKAGCLANECLFIGDTLEKDYYGSLSAGMSALWFNPDGHKNTEGVREISSLMQILECV